MRLGPLDFEQAHVRNVEGAAICSHRPVLFDHALVEHRHLVTGEGDHASAESQMAFIERRSLQLPHALADAIRPVGRAA